MKLFNFRQREPVAFDGNGVLFRESQIRFLFLKLEKQLNEQYGNEIMPVGFSIRNLVSSDFVFFKKQIKQDEHYKVFSKILPDRKSCQVVYDTNGCFLCVRITPSEPKYLSESQNNVMSWVNYQWTLDAQGNRLIQIDHMVRHQRLTTLCPLKKEFISIIGQSVVRRKISYDGLMVKKVETDLYTNEGLWIPTNEQSFPASHWKQVSEIYSQVLKTKDWRQFFVSMLLKLKFNH